MQAAHKMLFCAVRCSWHVFIIVSYWLDEEKDKTRISQLNFSTNKRISQRNCILPLIHPSAHLHHEEHDTLKMYAIFFEYNVREMLKTFFGVKMVMGSFLRIQVLFGHGVGVVVFLCRFVQKNIFS